MQNLLIKLWEPKANGPKAGQQKAKTAELVTKNMCNPGLTLANPEETYKITKDCNPCCIPCVKAHPPGNKDYEVFATRYPISDDLKSQENKTEAMKNRCEKTGINFTPTFFISITNRVGQKKYYEMPKIYSIPDLKYFFSMQ